MQRGVDLNAPASVRAPRFVNKIAVKIQPLQQRIGACLAFQQRQDGLADVTISPSFELLRPLPSVSPSRSSPPSRLRTNVSLAQSFLVRFFVVGPVSLLAVFTAIEGEAAGAAVAGITKKGLGARITRDEALDAFFSSAKAY